MVKITNDKIQMTNKIENSRLKLQDFKFCIILLVILAVLVLPVNFVLAEENPFGSETDKQPNLSGIEFQALNSQPSVVTETPTSTNNQITTDTTISIGSDNGDLIFLDTKQFNISSKEVWEGKKFKAFDKFVFDLDSESFKIDATLELKEIMLAPGSKMAPPTGMQMASKIYQFDLKPSADVKFAKDFWFSIKYDQIDYFRKNLYYYDENAKQWKGIKAIVSDGASKLIAKFSLPYAKVAILEDISIMTEGTASWYKYKGCNCAASPDYPKGTKLKVTNIDNGKSVVVKVNDWGPDRSVHPNRVIDLDIVAFKQIAKKSAGLCKVKVEPADQINIATNN